MPHPVNDWIVDLSAKTCRDLRSGVVVRFTHTADGEAVGKVVESSPVLGDLVKRDPGAIARLMREAGESYFDALGSL